MCGIAGVVSGQSEQLSRLTAMLDSLVHRGPDDAGEYVDAQVALGQRRLSIIDLEGGRQPLFNEDRSLAGAGKQRTPIQNEIRLRSYSPFI
jgi:asparagine synthase (glutamine-hydrolysing)